MCGSSQVTAWNISCYSATCRACLQTEPYHPIAASRLAELDAEAKASRTLSDVKFKIPMFFPEVEYVAVLDKSATALLVRVSDFIASIPGGALDRKSNAVAMQLRREIADAIVPKDKVRK